MAWSRRPSRRTGISRRARNSSRPRLPGPLRRSRRQTCCNSPARRPSRISSWPHGRPRTASAATSSRGRISAGLPPAPRRAVLGLRPVERCHHGLPQLDLLLCMDCRPVSAHVRFRMRHFQGDRRHAHCARANGRCVRLDNLDLVRALVSTARRSSRCKSRDSRIVTSSTERPAIGWTLPARSIASSTPIPRSRGAGMPASQWARATPIVTPARMSSTCSATLSPRSSARSSSAITRATIPASRTEAHTSPATNSRGRSGADSTSRYAGPRPGRRPVAVPSSRSPMVHVADTVRPTGHPSLSRLSVQSGGSVLSSGGHGRPRPIPVGSRPAGPSVLRLLRLRGQLLDFRGRLLGGGNHRLGILGEVFKQLRELLESVEPGLSIAALQGIRSLLTSSVKCPGISR